MTWLAAALAVEAGPLTVEVELSADERGLLVVGPNGAGKTTILRGLLGVRPARGTVRIGEELLFDSTRGLDVPTEERRLVRPSGATSGRLALALRGRKRTSRPSATTTSTTESACAARRSLSSAV